MLTIYGISNCDKVKQAKQFCKVENVNFSFVDFKKTPPTMAWLEKAVTALGWQALLNKRGTTYRGLSELQKADIGEEKALTLMQQYPSLIKRPVWQQGDQFFLGFDETVKDRVMKHYGSIS